MPWYKNTFVLTAVISIAALLCLRFGLVIAQPAPLYMDEIASAAHAAHLLDKSTTMNGDTGAVATVSLGGGYSTGTYLYPLAAWLGVGGVNDISLRLFSQLVTCLAALIVAYALYLWRGRRLGCLAAIIGLSLPWSWINGNVAWDPAITPLYLSLGVLFFTLLAVKRPTTPWRTNLYATGLTVALVAAAYSYPPYRVVAPLLLLGAIVYLMKAARIHLKQLLIICGVGLATSLPLAIFMLSPEAITRSANLSVFHDSWLQGVMDMFINLAKLASPEPLFLTGDANLRHSAGFGGMLGVAGFIGLAVLAYTLLARPRPAANYQLLAAMGGAGVLACLLGSALTNEAQPHYLRAVGAWPFFVILIALGWEEITRLPQKLLLWLLGGIGAISIGLFICYMSFVFPDKRTEYFNNWTAGPAEQRFVDYYTHR